MTIWYTGQQATTHIRQESVYDGDTALLLNAVEMVVEVEVEEE